MIEHRPIKGDFNPQKLEKPAKDRDKHPSERELKARFPAPAILQKGRAAVEKTKGQIKAANRVLDEKLKKAQQPRPAPPGVDIEAERKRAVQAANTEFRTKVDQSLKERDKTLQDLDKEQQKQSGRAAGEQDQHQAPSAIEHEQEKERQPERPEAAHQDGDENAPSPPEHENDGAWEFSGPAIELETIQDTSAADITPTTGWSSDAEREEAISQARERREADEREQEMDLEHDDPGREID